jgi:alpha-ketoglutarate-dependent taurine dioxygenase
MSVESKAIELPVIDVTNSDKSTAKQLIDAVTEHGFVYLKNNHDEIPTHDLDELFDLVGKVIDPSIWSRSHML